MDWNIYTVGSVDFIYNVFNAVAMLFNAGTFASLFKIAALLGVIAIVLSSAMSGGKTLSLSQMAVCVVMYLCLFQVSTRVNIEDATTGEFKAVDNVPWGIAAPASVISLVGYQVTKQMEQAFSTPSMTQYGALDPLFTMAALYDSMKDPMRWALNGSTVDNNADLQATMNSYLRTCVINDINRDANTYAHVWRNSSTISGLASTDGATYAIVYDGKGVNNDGSIPRNASQYPCTQALEQIQNQSAGAYSTLVKSTQKADQRYGRCDSNCDMDDRIQQAMSIYSLGSTNIRDFQLSMIALPIIMKMPEYAYLDAYKGNAAITRAQTTSQQSFQWASGGSSYLSWMGSFMPIFQGLIYALTPFMAFLLGMGLLGVRMIGKYFLIIVWTQTWTPLAAIVNLYMLTKMQTSAAEILEITSAGVNQATSFSFSQLYDLINETQKNVGLAGNLFSLIPALGGFIVWGSSVAFNSLASSAATPSAADTHTFAPDISNAPSVMNRTSDFSSSPMAGTTVTGAQSVVGSISMGETAQKNLASAQARKDSATHTQLAAQSKMMSNLNSVMNSGTHSQQMNDTMASSLQTQFGASYGKVQEYMNAHNMSAMDFASQMTSMEMQASGSVSKGDSIKGQAGAGIKGGTSDGHTSNYSDQAGGGNKDMASLVDSLGVGSDKKLASAIADTAAKTSSYGVSSSVASNFSDSNSQLESAEKSYSEAQTFSRSASSQQSIDLATLGNTVMNTPGVEQKIQQLLNDTPGGAAARDAYANPFHSAGGLNQEQALAAGSILALRDAGKLGEIASDIGFTSGASGPEITDHAATAYQGVGVQAGDVAANVRSGEGATSAGVSSVSAGAHSGVSSATATSDPTSARNQVQNFHDQSMPQVTDRNEQDRGIVAAKQSEASYESVARYQQQGILREGAGYIRSLTSRADYHNPVVQETLREAKSVMSQEGNNSKAANALAEYYALGKAGAATTSDTLEQARANAINQISLQTGGSVNANGLVTGGNREWAERATGLIESKFENQGVDDTSTLRSTIQGLDAANGRVLPSSHTGVTPKGVDLSGPRTNVDATSSSNGVGGEDGGKNEMTVVGRPKN